MHEVFACVLATCGAEGSHRNQSAPRESLLGLCSHEGGIFSHAGSLRSAMRSPLHAMSRGTMQTSALAPPVQQVGQ